MDEKAAISNHSKGEWFVVFENVFEYISDVATLASLTLVSKSARTAIYRSNGLRELSFENNYSCLKLNEVYISRENRRGKLKDGLRWLWTVGKRLKRLRLVSKNEKSWVSDLVYSVLNRLVTTKKRQIKTIKIRGMPCEMALELVRENRTTLRCLRVELWDQQYGSSLNSLQSSLAQCSHSEPPESEKFWFVVQHCERLESLYLCLRDPDSIPEELWNVLCGTPLKHLSLRGYFYNSEIRQKFIKLLSCDNLRTNLESLSLARHSFHWFFGGLAGKLTTPRLSAAFTNVKKLLFNFVEFCCQLNPVNWPVFWAIFPALNEIKDNSDNSYIYVPDTAFFLQNVVSFCKTYLEVSASQSREMKIEITSTVIPHRRSRSRVVKLIAALATAATLPGDQAWYVSHGVQIETEMSDQKIQRVTLRKDTSTVVFDFKYPDE